MENLANVQRPRSHGKTSAFVYSLNQASNYLALSDLYKGDTRSKNSNLFPVVAIPPGFRWILVTSSESVIKTCIPAPSEPKHLPTTSRSRHLPAPGGTRLISWRPVDQDLPPGSHWSKTYIMAPSRPRLIFLLPVNKDLPPGFLALNGPRLASRLLMDQDLHSGSRWIKTYVLAHSGPRLTCRLPVDQDLPPSSPWTKTYLLAPLDQDLPLGSQ